MRWISFPPGGAAIGDHQGDVDFIWGTGAVFVQNSELKMLTSGGFYTQIRNVQGKNGNVFVNCRLTGSTGVTGAFLSRIDPNVFPFSQVVYINSAMGPQVAPAVSITGVLRRRQPW